MCLHVCGSGFSANTTAIIGPDAQLLTLFHTLSVSLTFSRVSSFTIYKKCQLSHTPTLSRKTRPRRFPGTPEHHFLVLEQFELSDWTVSGDSDKVQKGYRRCQSDQRAVF